MPACPEKWKERTNSFRWWHCWCQCNIHLCCIPWCSWKAARDTWYDDKLVGHRGRKEEEKDSDDMVSRILFRQILSSWSGAHVGYVWSAFCQISCWELQDAANINILLILNLENSLKAPDVSLLPLFFFLNRIHVTATVLPVVSNSLCSFPGKRKSLPERHIWVLSLSSELPQDFTLFHGVKILNACANCETVSINKQWILCVIVVDLKCGILYFLGAHPQKWVPKGMNTDTGTRTHMPLYTHLRLVVWDQFLPLPW